ncbi:uncharacterized protein HaLaN_10202 [Haematococcus lacustris]|uniref:Uncharacterized protein n=1 Tax=Haematococcus lacustris TaxID=44745 RepID=A0A699Z545_HAELA|nr:uncharacterized protein HaLaN_10202 [Haematococcus lacustris]
MIRSFSQLLPQALRATWLPSGAARGFRAVADVEINLDDRETLKKYVGVRDHLSKEPGTRARFITAIRDLLEVVEANAAEADVEEVLDAHIEELMSEKSSLGCAFLVHGELAKMGSGHATEAYRIAERAAATGAVQMALVTPRDLTVRLMKASPVIVVTVPSLRAAEP